MSSIRRKQMSGSSQGRGGNTQQEPTTNGKVNTTEVLVETASRRMRSQQQSNSATGTDYMTRGDLTVEGVLEEIMIGNGPHLWESKLLQLIEEYDDKNNRRIIYAYRKALSALTGRLDRRDDSPQIRLILKKIVKSYKRRLEEAMGSHLGAPN